MKQFFWVNIYVLFVKAKRCNIKSILFQWVTNMLKRLWSCSKFTTSSIFALYCSYKNVIAVCLCLTIRFLLIGSLRLKWLKPWICYTIIIRFMTGVLYCFLIPSPAQDPNKNFHKDFGLFFLILEEHQTII